MLAKTMSSLKAFNLYLQFTKEHKIHCQVTSRNAFHYQYKYYVQIQSFFKERLAQLQKYHIVNNSENITLEPT